MHDFKKEVRGFIEEWFTYYENLPQGEEREAMVDNFSLLAKTCGHRKLWMDAFGHMDDIREAFEKERIPIHCGTGDSWYLFLDDESDLNFIGEKEDRLWAVCRSSEDAIRLTNELRVPPCFMSLDHDLGGDDTSMKYLRWATSTFPEWRFDYQIHSQNSVGSKNIESLLESFKKSQDL